MLSIIIPAYQASKFLQECIASIESTCEILIGIDHCQDTLDHIQNNEAFYKHTRIFYFTERVGPFVIKNTLSDHASYDKLLFFDADDVMIEGTIPKVGKLLEEFSYVKLNYVNFVKITHPDKLIRNDAVIGIRKDVFNKMNGFVDWKCAADTEFLKRLEANHVSFATMFGSSYYRRLHGNNLTMHPSTNFVSPIRKKYVEILETNAKNKSWKNPKTKIKTESYADYTNAQRRASDATKGDRGQ